MNDLLNKQLEFYDALEFLKNHPALNVKSSNWSELGVGGLEVEVFKCCKRGLYEWCKDEEIKFYEGEDHWDEILKLNPDVKIIEEKDCFDEAYRFIKGSYEELFLESWELDHMSYSYELNITYYQGKEQFDDDEELKNPYDDLNSFKREYWTGFRFFEDGDKTLEDAIIKLANQVKEQLGDFCMDDFRENHEKDYSSPTYVPDAVANLRWFKQFLEKKLQEVEDGEYSLGHDWAEELLERSNKLLENIPETRRRLSDDISLEIKGVLNPNEEKK